MMWILSWKSCVMMPILSCVTMMTLCVTMPILSWISCVTMMIESWTLCVTMPILSWTSCVTMMIWSWTLCVTMMIPSWTLCVQCQYCLGHHVLQCQYRLAMKASTEVFMPPNDMSCTVSCRHRSHTPVIALLACQSKVHVMYLYVSPIDFHCNFWEFAQFQHFISSNQQHIFALEAAF